jgi:hypothetical protein
LLELHGNRLSVLVVKIVGKTRDFYTGVWHQTSRCHNSLQSNLIERRILTESHITLLSTGQKFSGSFLRLKGTVLA